MPLEPERVEAAAPPAPPSRIWRWYQIFSALLFIIFCFELGVFLLVFPWLEYWDRNWFSALIPEWHRYWENPYVRGAVSGIGAINLYIAVTEIFRLRRFAVREEPQ